MAGGGLEAGQGAVFVGHQSLGQAAATGGPIEAASHGAIELVVDAIHTEGAAFVAGEAAQAGPHGQQPGQLEAWCVAVQQPWWEGITAALQVRR